METYYLDLIQEAGYINISEEVDVDYFSVFIDENLEKKQATIGGFFYEKARRCLSDFIYLLAERKGNLWRNARVNTLGNTVKVELLVINQANIVIVSEA